VALNTINQTNLQNNADQDLFVLIPNSHNIVLHTLYSLRTGWGHRLFYRRHLKRMYFAMKVRGHVFVLGISNEPLFTIFLLDFETVLTVCYFLQVNVYNMITPLNTNESIKIIL
jgi:hypothetical protein